MQIPLDLTKYCIETAARKAHEKLVRMLMKGRCADQMLIEAQLEALQFFLENGDFGYLRSSFKELNGNHNLKVSLQIPVPASSLTILAGDQEIKPKWRNHL
jgi:hypothetical protein